MARRTFDVVDIIEILVHWHAGRNNSEIAQSLGVDRKTARKYVAAAEAAGMSAGRAAGERGGVGRQLVREWFPELADTRLRQVTWPAIERASRVTSREQLKAGVTVATIHQRLRDERGAGGQHRELPPVCGGEPAGGDAPVAGQGAAAVAGRAGRRGADRLRAAGPLAGPGGREAGHGVGVRDGAGLLAAPVRAAGDPAGPAGVERVPCGGVRVLRRGPGPAGAGQPQDRGGPAGPV